MQHSKSSASSASKCVSLDFTSELKIAEQQWDIRAEVAQEWEPTFDRLLTFYNTQDINTIVSTFGKNEVFQTNKNDKLPIKELRKWIKPKFEPPTWKKLFCHSQYKKDKLFNIGEFESLFGGTEEAENDALITRVQFIDRIMEELRDGNKNVCISSNMMSFVAFFLRLIVYFIYFLGGHFSKECFPSFGKGRILFVVAATMVSGYCFYTTNPEIRIS
jgi:hypothetical protein